MNRSKSIVLLVFLVTLTASTLYYAVESAKFQMLYAKACAENVKLRQAQLALLVQNGELQDNYMSLQRKHLSLQDSHVTLQEKHLALMVDVANLTMSDLTGQED